MPEMLDMHYQPTGNWATHPHRNCRGMDPNVFMVERGAKNVAAVKAICDGCPVLEPCREYAISDPTFVGIIGGTSGAERRLLRRERRGDGTIVSRRLVADCGTTSGYQRHRRLNEPACDECRQANSRASLDRLQAMRARRKGQAA